MIKKIFPFIYLITLSLLICGCENKVEKEKYLSGKHYVEMNIQNKGTISLELDADTAPITVTNFVKLVKEGFYDGLTFHRVVEGFMIQGGDPDANGTGGSKEKIKGEFEANGITNDISHKRGVISMARANPYDSASSQFFIMHADYPSLNGLYAAFGHVTKGMDIVDDIAKNTIVESDGESVAFENQPVIEYIKVLEK